MIGKTLTVINRQIVDRVQYGDRVKIFFKLEENPDLIYVGNLLSLSTSGNYKVIITGDNKSNIDPEVENV